MFDLLDRPLVWIPVKWPGLQQSDDSDVATVVTHEIELQVEILDREEFGKWIAANERDAANAEVNAVDELAIFKTVAKGWRRIKAGGRAVEWNDDNIGKLLRFPGFVVSFGATYMRAWQGQAETRSGNSESSPANGRAGAAPSETSKVEKATS